MWERLKSKLGARAYFNLIVISGIVRRGVKLRDERRLGERLAETVSARNPQFSHRARISNLPQGIMFSQWSRGQAIATLLRTCAQTTTPRPKLARVGNSFPRTAIPSMRNCGGAFLLDARPQAGNGPRNDRVIGQVAKSIAIHIALVEAWQRGPAAYGERLAKKRERIV
jgi:hypothetical protein